MSREVCCESIHRLHIPMSKEVCCESIHRLHIPMSREACYVCMLDYTYV